jgi:hypothetical protein
VASPVTIRAQIDTVNIAKKFLLEHSSVCKDPKHIAAYLAHRGQDKKERERERDHIPGSQWCIVAFLGESNWPRSKVKGRGSPYR